MALCAWFSEVNSDDAKQATKILERATKKAPQDARPLYGLALARVGGYGRRRGDVAQSGREVLAHEELCARLIPKS